MSESQLLSKTGSLGGQKSEQLCPSSSLLDSSTVKTQRERWSHPKVSETSKPIERGRARSCVTSHLFEPQQFRGLQLRGHGSPDPAQDPVARVCYASGLVFSAVVHPHHHVLVPVTCSERGPITNQLSMIALQHQAADWLVWV